MIYLAMASQLCALCLLAGFVRKLNHKIILIIPFMAKQIKMNWKIGSSPDGMTGNKSSINSMKESIFVEKKRTWQRTRRITFGRAIVVVRLKRWIENVARMRWACEQLSSSSLLSYCRLSFSFSSQKMRIPNVFRVSQCQRLQYTCRPCYWYRCTKPAIPCYTHYCFCWIGIRLKAHRHRYHVQRIAGCKRFRMI